MSVTAIIQADTRGRLLRVAESLFAGNGYELTSTRQIAAMAGLNMSLINYYFGGKLALYREIFSVRLEEMNSVLQSVTWQQLTPTAKLGKLLNIYIGRFRHNLEFQRMLYREILFLSGSAVKDIIGEYLEKNAAVFDEIMQEGIASGEFRPLDASFFYMTVISILSMIIYEAPVGGKIPGQEYSTDEIKKYLYQILLTKNTEMAAMN